MCPLGLVEEFTQSCSELLPPPLLLVLPQAEGKGKGGGKGLVGSLGMEMGDGAKTRKERREERGYSEMKRRGGGHKREWRRMKARNIEIRFQSLFR